MFFLAGSSLRRHPQHAHYTGTIQVMKAVGSHLVLTFCEKTELFTVILFREKNVKALDVSVEKIIVYKNKLEDNILNKNSLIVYRLLILFVLYWTAEV